MTKAKEDRIKNTVKALMQLDEKSLLLVDSGARLLVARQELEKAADSNKQLLKT